MNALETIERLKLFLHKQISSLAMSNPLIGFTKPVILRIVDNNIHKANGFLSMLADENGDIEMQSLIPEMTQSVMTTRPFVYHT